MTCNFAYSFPQLRWFSLTIRRESAHSWPTVRVVSWRRAAGRTPSSCNVPAEGDTVGNLQRLSLWRTTQRLACAMLMRSRIDCTADWRRNFADSRQVHGSLLRRIKKSGLRGSHTTAHGSPREREFHQWRRHASRLHKSVCCTKARITLARRSPWT